MKTSLSLAALLLLVFASPAWAWRILGQKEIFPSELLILQSEAAIEGLDQAPRKGSTAAKKASLTDEFPPVNFGSAVQWFRMEFSATKGETLSAEVTCDRFLKPSILGFTVKAAGVYTVSPVLQWRADALYALTEPEPAVITFRLLRRNGEELERTDLPVVFRSINVCTVGDKDLVAGEWSFSPIYAAAYVDEDHPMIAEILQEAIDRKLVKAFFGAKGHDLGQAMNELDAIWQVLQLRKVRYSSMARLGRQVLGERAQNIRFLDETLNSAQANCVDGSVMLASILAHLGHRTELQFLPGHCVVSASVVNWKCAFETTLLGNPAMTMRDATQAGAKRVTEIMFSPLGQAKGYKDTIVDISAARQLGIRPLRPPRIPTNDTSDKGKP